MSKFGETLDDARQANLEQALAYLNKIRDAHWEFDGYGGEHVLDGEFWDGVDKVLDFFCLIPKPPGSAYSDELHVRVETPGLKR
jgi:hypothetical protein